MKIIVIGASGTLGKAVSAELGQRHDIVAAGRHSGARADIRDIASLRALFARIERVDAIVATTGSLHFGPLADTTPEQFNVGLQDKLLGQINVVLAGLPHLAGNGSITLTSGIVGREPIRHGSNATTVNAALEGFVRAAATEIAPRRINIVSPTVLAESIGAYGPYFPGFEAVPAARAARAYARSVEGVQTGRCYRVE